MNKPLTRHRSALWITLTIQTCFVCFAPHEAAGQDVNPRKLAFLVGVDEYQKDGLNDLNYSDDDVRELDKVLRGIDFSVELIVGRQATRENVAKRFSFFLDQTKKLSKQDIVFVALTGHGLQIEVERGGVRVSDSFFCPFDAQKSDPTSLISISGLMQSLSRDSASSQNLLVIDACRDDPNRGAKGLDGSTVKELPAKLSVLFACSSGQQSFESDVVKHGVFTHVLLEGLRGAAANPRGEITWLNLASHVSTEVPTRLPKLLPGLARAQRPNLVSNTTSNPALGVVNVIPPPPPPPPPPPRNEVLYVGRPWVLHVEDNSSSDRRVFLRELVIDNLKSDNEAEGKVQRTHANEGRFGVTRDPASGELTLTLERLLNRELSTITLRSTNLIEAPTTFQFTKSSKSRQLYKQTVGQYTIYVQDFPADAFPLSPFVANIRPNGIFPAVGLGLEEGEWRYQLFSDGKKPWQPLNSGTMTFLLGDLCETEDKMFQGVIGFTLESVEEQRRNRMPMAITYEIHADDEKLVSRNSGAYTKPIEITQKIPRGTRSLRISVPMERGKLLWSDFHLTSTAKASNTKAGTTTSPSKTK